MGPDPLPPLSPCFSHIVLCSALVTLALRRTVAPSETVRWCSCISRRSSDQLSHCWPSFVLPYFSNPPSPLSTPRRSPFEAAPYLPADKCKTKTRLPYSLCKYGRELLHGRWTGWAHFFQPHLPSPPSFSILYDRIPYPRSRRVDSCVRVVATTETRNTKAAKAHGCFTFP